MLFEFASGQIQGKRTAQEDTVDVLLPSESHDRPGELCRAGAVGALVMVVADGMGGHVGGRIASNLSSKYFLDAVNKTAGSWAERLDQALVQANDVLRTATEKRPELDGMGSTLVGAIVNEHGVGWVSIGDSGLYLFRDGALHRLNEDHSFGAYLDDQARQGLLTAEQAAQDRRRNQLFHALLGDPIDHYERFGGFRELKPGDVLLVASDGLKTLSDEQVGALIAAEAEAGAEALAARLLAAVEAENRERQDNTSVIVVRVREGEAPPRSPEGSETSTTVPLALLGVGADEPLGLLDEEDASYLVDPSGHRPLQPGAPAEPPASAPDAAAPPAAAPPADPAADPAADPPAADPPPAPARAAPAAAATAQPAAAPQPAATVDLAGERPGGGMAAALTGLIIGFALTVWLFRDRLPPWPF